MDNTIYSWQKHFDELYGLRNCFVNGSFHERVTHMTRRIGRIYDSKRKDAKMPGRLARAVSYFMSCVNYFGPHLDLELGMMEKFPSFGCRYCTHLPCDCPEDRLDPTGYDVDESQRKWSVSEWQDHLMRVYGHYNIGNFDKPYGRLTSEFGEFGILVVGGPNTPIHPSRRIVQCRREAADVFSWILTIAYAKGINLEEATNSRYSTCPGCFRSFNCECPTAFVSPDGMEFSMVGTPEFMDRSKGSGGD